MESTWPRKVCRHRSLFTSQSLADWSIEHDTRKSPESWKARSHTAWEWSANVAEQEDFTKSHNFTVPSPEQVARCVPPGWKSTEETQSRCPSPDIISSPLGIAHIF